MCNIFKTANAIMMAETILENPYIKFYKIHEKEQFSKVVQF